MSDSAFATAAYPSCTTAELEALRAHGTINARQLSELARREAVAGGDMTQATPGERLRAVRAADIAAARDARGMADPLNRLRAIGARSAPILQVR